MSLARKHASPLVYIIYVVAPVNGSSPRAANPTAGAGPGRKARLASDTAEVVDAIPQRVGEDKLPATEAVVPRVGWEAVEVVGDAYSLLLNGGEIRVVVGVDLQELLVHLLDRSVEDDGGPVGSGRYLP